MKKYFPDQLPKKFKQNVLDLCGDEGKEWLTHLPATIEELEDAWGIKAGRYFPNLSYNYVASCTMRDGQPAVLKIAPPLREPEIFNEAKALQIFKKRGAAEVLRIDRRYRAILVERLIPGKHLLEIYQSEPQKAVEIAISVMKRLYRNSPPQDEFTTVDHWLYKLEKAEQSDFLAVILREARELFEELNSDKSKVRFLHGDLHHENILTDGNGDFAVIDPSGINGNIGYEIGLFLRVHARVFVDDKQIVDAVEMFSDSFGISFRDVANWAFVQNVLSAAWDFEDNGKNWREEIERAKKWKRI
ncbi:MAG: aminoglycoside phosphotransferase family protein [Pyrinomonadaceae bacterium]